MRCGCLSRCWQRICGSSSATVQPAPPSQDLPRTAIFAERIIYLVDELKRTHHQPFFNYLVRKMSSHALQNKSLLVMIVDHSFTILAVKRDTLNQDLLGKKIESLLPKDDINAFDRYDYFESELTPKQ
jgi:hypothetical protein